MPLHGLHPNAHSRSHSHSDASHNPSVALAQTASLAGVAVPSAGSVAAAAAHAHAHAADGSPLPQSQLRDRASQQSLPPPLDTGARSLRVSTAAVSSGAQSRSPGTFPAHLPPPHAGGGGGAAAAAASAVFESPQDLHHHPQPIYAAYHAPAQPVPSSTSSSAARPAASHTATAPAAVPALPIPLQQQQQQRSTMHRTSTQQAPAAAASSSRYSPPIEGRKYTHPGALTPTYSAATGGTAGQHSSGHVASSHLGMGLSGMATGSNSPGDAEEPQQGPAGKGRWMSSRCLYAVDWCKWQPTSGYGRVAVASYAEDSHNYVRGWSPHAGELD